MLMRENKQLLSCWSTRGCQGSGVRETHSLQIWPGSCLMENNTGNKYLLWACKIHPRIAQLLILGISEAREEVIFLCFREEQEHSRGV